MMLAAPFLLLSLALADGESLYLSQCSICHGQKGEGGRGSPLARARLRHAPDDAALQRVIRRGIDGTDMPSSWMNEEEIRQVAVYVRTLGRVKAAPVPGDIRKGEAIYNGKGGCVNCHTLAGVGSAFGPDLTGIGDRRSPAHLRTSLVNPGDEISTGFFEIRAVAANGGRTIRGTRVNEDTFSIQLRDASNTVHSLWKADLSSLEKKMQSSLMPAYERSLTTAELDDLVAFLSTRREEPAQ